MTSPASSSSAGPATGCRSRPASRGSSTRWRASSTSACSHRGARSPAGDATFTLVPPFASASARRPALLAGAAGSRRAAAARLPSRRRRLPDGVRRGRGTRCAPALTRAGPHHRRGARGLADRDPAVRLSARAGCSRGLGDARRARPRFAGPTRFAPCRRSRRARRRARGRADARLPGLHGSRAVHACRRSRSRASGRALRRRSRAVQEHRRPRCGVAARGAARRGGVAAARRQGHAGRRQRRSSASTASDGTRSSPRRRSPRALDDAWVLVLPSRSEGMGRVLVEAFCRGRAVVGTRAGSIPDLVDRRRLRRARRAGRSAGARRRARACALRPRAGGAARGRRARGRSAVAADARAVRAADAGARRVRVVFVDAGRGSGHIRCSARRLPRFARSLHESTRSSSSPTRVDAEALPENCRAHSFAAPSQAGRGARYVAALAPELASEAGGGPRAHVADLCVARRAARASACACRCCSGSRSRPPGRRCAARARRRRPADGRRAEHSPALAEGAGDRTRHRRRRAAAAFRSAARRCGVCSGSDATRR